MKNTFLTLLLAGAISTLGCNPNHNQSSGQTGATDTVTENNSALNTTEQPTVAQPAIQPRDKEAQATAELCACVNSFLADMSPKVRQVIINASKSSTPLQTLSNELQQVQGAAEQERLIRELEKFESNSQLQRCSESIKEKYKLDENNEASRDKVLQAAREDKDCEVLYALMTIGLEQEKNARSSGR